MLGQRIRAVKNHLQEFVRLAYGVELEEIIFEVPPQIEFGDIAFPFPFQLARTVRRAPRLIAEEIAKGTSRPAGVERIEAAGSGYINVFFDRASFLQDLYLWLHAPEPEPSGEKIIVEHTNINPNKAAHIGHLRNAVLGDTFVRLLRARGYWTEVQNYIDNTGVQVADVVVGFQFLRGMSVAQVRAIPEPFDYYCWDLYAEVSDWYAQDAGHLERRLATLQAIESGGNELSELAEYVSNRIVSAHLRTMERIGARYDVLPRESEILHLRFWDTAFAQLKEAGAIYFAEAGPNQGCWVMQLPGDESQLDEDKIIVRSNGTVTYVGKDIAYQLWKFGLLGKTFHYRPFHSYPDGKVVWMSSSDPSDGEPPTFGGAHKVYNVIDVRQSYLQRVVVQGLRSLGYQEQSANSVHFSYEMVALSPKCCAEMGIQLSPEDQARPYVEVSGRKGLGVKADDLLDKLFENSLKEVNSRQEGLPLEEREEIARKIAVGALRYFLLKFTRNSVIAFDFAEALSFEGETGPYLQYSVVRSHNIFRKLAARESAWAEDAWKERLLRGEGWPADAGTYLKDNEIWRILLQVAQIDEVIDQALETLELSGVTRHAFSLAQQFNLFYHRYHILSEGDRAKRDFYLIVADTSRQALLRLLALSGIEVPGRM